MKFVVLAIAILLGVSACQNEPHATVHGTFSEAVPAVVDSGYVMSTPDGVPRGYKLSSEEVDLPPEHEAFVMQAGYPQTYSVWMNPELMQKDGQKLVRILLGQQRGLYLVDGAVAMDFPVCTGRGNKRTPTGTFSIKQKNIDHHSNLYDCPMPYFMRLTWSGIGMHVGDVYRQPASHGCIRLPRVACEPLYHALPYGSLVEITD